MAWMPSGLVAATVFFAGAACAPAALDPMATPTTGGTPSSLAALAGPSTRLIVGSNAGAVINGASGRVSVFEQDPGELVDAAAAASMPACSVELRRLATGSQPADLEAIAIEDAVADCDGFDYGFVLDQLSASKLPTSLVLIGTNAAIRMGGTDHGFAYYYDQDVIRLLRAARKLYIPACIVVPDALEIPLYPEGHTTGLSIDEARARCGR